jgi:hypothetical protein
MKRRRRKRGAASSRSKTEIRWPKPYTTALTRAQIRFVIKVHALDRAARAKIGLKRGTNGLYARLARELRVKPRLIHDICTARRRGRDRFRDIKINRERTNARRERRKAVTSKPTDA